LAATIQTGKAAFAGVASVVGSALAAVAKITVRPSTPIADATALEPAPTGDAVPVPQIPIFYSTRTFGADAYHVGENQVVWLPTNLRAGAPLLVVCHGTAAQASWYSESSERYRPLEGVAGTGIVVIAGDLGEPSNADGWGNDLSVARVWEVVDWAESEFGCDTTLIHLRGESAGGATALNAARERPAQTGSVHLAAGVCDIEAIYQGGAGNSLLVDLIDMAYAVGGGWPAQRATHDPALNTAELVPLADRIRCYYTSGDGLVPPQATIDFAAAVGCGLIPVGDMPHSDAVLTAIQAGDLASWIWDLHT
jgi:pimeloyl-ACP methyl ester carboxylesterase